MTTDCETQASEAEGLRETVRALERRLDEVRGERDEARAEVEWRERGTRDSYPDAVPGHWKRRAEDMQAERDALAERLAAITKFCGEEVKVDAPWLTPALLAQVKGAFEGVLAHVRALAAPRGDGR